MANNYPEKSTDQNFNLQLFINKCKSKWSWYLIAFILFGLLGTYIHLRNVPTYEVTANIMIYEESTGGATIQMARQFSLGNVFGGSALVDNEIKVLKSHSVMRQTAKDLGFNVSYTFKDGLFKEVPLYQKMPFVLKCDSTIADTIKTALTFKLEVDKNGLLSGEVKKEKDLLSEIKDEEFPVKVETPYGLFTFEKTDYFKDGKSLNAEIFFESYDSAAETLSKEVSVSIPDKKSDLINITWLTPDPIFGKTLINTIIENYNEKVIQDSRDRDRKTAHFIEERLHSLEAELNLSEDEIEQFQKNRNLVDLETEAKIVMAKTLEYEHRLDSAQTEFNLLKRTREFISNPENKYSLITLDRSASQAAPLLLDYNEMILKRIELSTVANENNLALQNIDEQLNAYRQNIIETLDKNYETSKFRLDAIKRLYNEYNGKLNDIPTDIKAYRGIERQQAIKEQLYLFLLQQREETALRIANAQPRAIIVDEAYIASDVHKTSMMFIGVIVLILTLLLPTGLIYLRGKIRNRFDSRLEIEQETSAPILGEICKTKRHEVIAVKPGSKTIISEMFRIVRTNLRFILHRKSEKVIMVTSSISGEGKSFISINLAMSFAMLGKKVVLVEMDLRKPKLANYLDIEPRLGLSDYLSSEDIHLKSIISHLDIDGVSIDTICAGPVPPNPSELLSVEKVEEMFAQLREEYDYIIIDSTPMRNISDSLIISPYVDATIYVCRLDYTPRTDFASVNELIEDQRLKKISILINGASSKGLHLYEENH